MQPTGSPLNWHNTIIFNRWPGKDQDKSDIVEQAVVTRRNGTVLVLNIRGSGQDSIPDRMDGPEWFHAKVVVQGDGVKVYLNGGEEPSIEVGAVFDGDRKGVLGLCGGGGLGFYFANFRYNTVE
jgi:UDP-N-acetyl-D-mannosaminuronic acid transferase (WecB/TagA/CpsF family)